MQSIAFYAPMKSPDHPVPSGDRSIARLLILALQSSGYKVEVISQLRSHMHRPDASTIAELKQQAQVEASRITELLGKRTKPVAWFTYHLYYKAVDWLGPLVCQRMDIPYVVAEASHAPKRLQGGWSDAERAVQSALRLARRIFTLNPTDEPCLREFLDTEAAKIVTLKPFLDTMPIDRACPLTRKQVAREFALDKNKPWLVTSAMFRAGDKYQSYAFLSRVLQELPGNDWQLLIIGAGDERVSVKNLFVPVSALSISFAGFLPQAKLYSVLKCCDLFIWPAINEAFGMAMLEAQACGLPIIAGFNPGVASIIADRQSGILCDTDSPSAMAAHTRELLRDPAKRRRYGENARQRIRRQHSIECAADILASNLQAITG